MKMLMMLIAALMLCVPVYAESADVIPVQSAEPANGHIALEEAITKALQELPVIPESYQTRAELVSMSDDSSRWIITVFDLSSLSNGWCVELDAFSAQVEASCTAYNGFFLDVYDRWAAQKGLHALWSLEDKQLYDALYALLPAYGLPMAGDLTQEQALSRALFALGLANAEGYEVGYGYLMGGEGYSGVWEICLVKDGTIAYRVNLDAVSGEVYYMEPDDGNG